MRFDLILFVIVHLMFYLLNILMTLIIIKYIYILCVRVCVGSVYVHYEF